MRKILTFLCAALMSVGMWAAPIVVTWNSSDLPGYGTSFSKDGVTLTCDVFDYYQDEEEEEGSTNISGPGTFTNDLGNFTQIEVTAGYFSGFGGDGWEEDEENGKMIWTGHVANVLFDGEIMGLTSIVFTIEPGAPVFALTPKGNDVWDADTKTLTVNSNPGYQAYAGQTVIEHVIISNSVTSIEQMAFEDCTGLKSVTIGDDVVTSIGDYAFDDCSALTSVTIGNSVTSIGGDAFRDCSSLSSVTIPNSVNSIGGGAFYGCGGLTSVTIGNGVTSIGGGTFQGCTGLTSVTIGNHVTSIGMRAFQGCPLTSVTIDATTPPTLGNWAFNYVDVSACKLYVPASSASAYKAASTWQSFDFYANPTAHEEPQSPGTYYSTFYDSDDIYSLPTGVEAYVATLSGSNLLLTKIAEAGEYIPNNCAVILKSTVESYDLFISKETPVTFTATNSLEGTDVAKATPANCYVLSCENNQVGFYQYSGAQVAAHKAYVVFSGSNQAPRRMPFIFDAATGVENVQGDKVQSTKVLRDGQLIIIKNGVRYNAQGQKVK